LEEVTNGLELDHAGNLFAHPADCRRSDFDATGRPQLLYPQALAAQVCYQGDFKFTSTDGSCPLDGLVSNVPRALGFRATRQVR